MLQKVNFLPGFNKQVTPTGAEGQWTGGDYIRFRYGTPEKLGGWDQLGEDKLTGAARALHHFDDNAGIKYAAIGTLFPRLESVLFLLLFLLVSVIVSIF